MMEDFGKRIEIVVKTNMPKTKIISEKDGILKIDVKALPEHGKANLEIVKFFSKLSKKEVKIVKGLTSKKKVLRFL